ncbi:substrate-binding domain-containing protein [Zavarzinia compransoris]|uniref:Phosphate ABC transporter substrate-binding protein n=1 Tax=Zavarzinia compransoris TaxID=1264899 RepID=A0A317DUH4_9PROT|nr:substrate-binding domain-containing protein [Zavarzinia compransoris]PWR18329.1 phosphate ABC transporter substrate-binding protein [Zavarzinia compransoris]TDP43611.1 phosphate ABC transporter substrate-binding protein (PhoT family) [Zavarzinia compransoris]
MTIRNTLAIVGATAVLACAFAGQAAARDQIRIVGSSTVFPFTTAVAEAFGKAGAFKTPVVESTGTGGGLKLFCAGVGEDQPDITNASRRIKASEFETCGKNGVTAITEIKIGFDGLVVANSKASPVQPFTKAQLWKALAAEVVVDGKVVVNPYKTWNEIDPSLPAKKIELIGPPPTSGTRDSFNELILEKGCEAAGALDAMVAAGIDKKDAAAKCMKIREDGAYVEAGENDNLIVQKLVSNPDAFGAFGYSFLEENLDKIQGSPIDGTSPEYDDISAGKYAVARSMFVYVKNQHVGLVPGLKEFVAEYTSSKAMGEGGYLQGKGLVVLPKDELEQVRAHALAFAPLSGADLK